MANKHKTQESTQRQKRTVGERGYFPTNVFADEYAELGVQPEMTLSEASTQIRVLLGVPFPLRRKNGKSGGVSAMARAFATASDEKRARIAQILAEDNDTETLE